MNLCYSIVNVKSLRLLPRPLMMIPGMYSLADHLVIILLGSIITYQCHQTLIAMDTGM